MTWLITSQAALKLNKNPVTLRRRIQSGEFRHGTEYRVVTSCMAKRKEYEFNIDAINLLWNTPPEKRKLVKFK